MEKFRVVWHDVCDPHFRPMPDKILFASDDYEECKEFFNTQERGWGYLTLEEARTITRYFTIENR